MAYFSYGMNLVKRTIKKLSLQGAQSHLKIIIINFLLTDQSYEVRQENHFSIGGFRKINEKKCCHCHWRKSTAMFF